jgi:hypothetical protein
LLAFRRGHLVHPTVVMSALPPKADMCGATRNVRFGPKADIELSALAPRRRRTADAVLSGYYSLRILQPPEYLHFRRSGIVVVEHAK